MQKKSVKKEIKEEKKVSEWMGAVGFILGVSIILFTLELFVALVYVAGQASRGLFSFLALLAIDLILGIVFLVIGLKKEKEINWMNILGICLLVALAYIFVSKLILFALIIGLIFSIIQLAKNKTKLAVAGLIINIIIILLIILSGWVIDILDPMIVDVECTQAKLTLIQANSLDDTVEVRRFAGGADVNVTSVKILVSKPGAARDSAATITNPLGANQSIGELETIVYTISEDIKEGDTINIAAIVLTSKGINTVCDIASSIKAVA